MLGHSPSLSRGHNDGEVNVSRRRNAVDLDASSYRRIGIVATPVHGLPNKVSVVVVVPIASVLTPAGREHVVKRVLNRPVYRTAYVNTKRGLKLRHLVVNRKRRRHGTTCKAYSHGTSGCGVYGNRRNAIEVDSAGRGRAVRPCNRRSDGIAVVVGAGNRERAAGIIAGASHSHKLTDARRPNTTGNQIAVKRQVSSAGRGLAFGQTVSVYSRLHSEGFTPHGFNPLLASLGSEEVIAAQDVRRSRTVLQVERNGQVFVSAEVGVRRNRANVHIVEEHLGRAIAVVVRAKHHIGVVSCSAGGDGRCRRIKYLPEDYRGRVLSLAEVPAISNTANNICIGDDKADVYVSVRGVRNLNANLKPSLFGGRQPNALSNLLNLVDVVISARVGQCDNTAIGVNKGLRSGGRKTLGKTSNRHFEILLAALSPVAPAHYGRAGAARGLHLHARRTEDTANVLTAEGVTLKCLELGILGVKVVVVGKLSAHTLLIGNAVLNISQDEEGVSISQEVVYDHAFRQVRARLDGVDGVVGRVVLHFRLEDAGSLKLQLFRHDQLAAFHANQVATVVAEVANINQHLLKRGFRQVSRSGQLVAERVASLGDMVGSAQLYAIREDEVAVKGVVVHVRRNSFLRYAHRATKGTSTRLGVLHVLVICTRFLRDDEAQTVGNVGQAIHEALFHVLIRNRRAFRLDGSEAQTAETSVLLIQHRGLDFGREARLPNLVLLTIRSAPNLLKPGAKGFGKRASGNSHWSFLHYTPVRPMAYWCVLNLQTHMALVPIALSAASQRRMICRSSVAVSSAVELSSSTLLMPVVADGAANTMSAFRPTEVAARAPPTESS